MTDTQILTPDERNARLDGPVHTWFGLSYSNYLVLPRTLMQSMPVAWQERMVACLEEAHAAFVHVEHADCYEVTAAEEMTYADLSDKDMHRLGVTVSTDSGEFGVLYYDRDGTERQPYDRVLIPAKGGDPVPTYDRGRTFIEPLAVTEDVA